MWNLLPFPHQSLASVMGEVTLLSVSKVVGTSDKNDMLLLEAASLCVT